MQVFTDSNFLQVVLTCPGVGLSMGCRVDVCSDLVPCAAQESLLRVWSTSPPSSYTDLGAYRAVSHISFLISPCGIFSQGQQQLDSWLRCVLQQLTGPGWSCCIQNMLPQPLLTETNPAAPQ